MAGTTFQLMLRQEGSSQPFSKGWLVSLLVNLGQGKITPRVSAVSPCQACPPWLDEYSTPACTNTKPEGKHGLNRWGVCREGSTSPMYMVFPGAMEKALQRQWYPPSPSIRGNFLFDEFTGFCGGFCRGTYLVDGFAGFYGGFCRGTYLFDGFAGFCGGFCRGTYLFDGFAGFCGGVCLFLCGNIIYIIYIYDLYIYIYIIYIYMIYSYSKGAWSQKPSHASGDRGETREDLCGEDHEAAESQPHLLGPRPGPEHSFWV